LTTAAKDVARARTKVPKIMIAVMRDEMIIKGYRVEAVTAFHIGQRQSKMSILAG
jgi:hypothetical protein